MPSSLRTGIDLIEIERFIAAYERFNHRFLQRIFTPTELAENRDNMPSLAARFAAKEAVAKAFGTGIGVITWHEIEILRGSSGEPILQLYGKAQQMTDEQKITGWSLSLSHTHSHAVAVVVAMVG